jgi:acetyl esterase/lipase
LTWELIDWFVKNVLDDRKDLDSPKYSPLYQDLKRIPQTLIISAELDAFIDMAKIYKEKIESFPENSIDMIILKGTLHGFFNSGPLCEKAIDEAVKYATDFLNKIKVQGGHAKNLNFEYNLPANESASKSVDQSNESCTCALM